MLESNCCLPIWLKSSARKEGVKCFICLTFVLELWLMWYHTSLTNGQILNSRKTASLFSKLTQRIKKRALCRCNCQGSFLVLNVLYVCIIIIAYTSKSKQVQNIKEPYAGATAKALFLVFNKFCVCTMIITYI